VRDMLKTWCEEGILAANMPGSDETDEEKTGGGARIKLSSGLRSLPLTALALLALMGLGWLRWTASPEPGPDPGMALRLSQLRGEVVTAAQLYRYQQGSWPENLQVMVRGGQLDPSVLGTVEKLGWNYELDAKRDAFSLGS